MTKATWSYGKQTSKGDASVHTRIQPCLVPMHKTNHRQRLLST